jgi:adenosine deaminase
MQEAFKLDKEDIYNIAKNSFEASFLDTSKKEEMIAKLDGYMHRNS